MDEYRYLQVRLRTRQLRDQWLLDNDDWFTLEKNGLTKWMNAKSQLQFQAMNESKNLNKEN